MSWVFHELLFYDLIFKFMFLCRELGKIFFLPRRIIRNFRDAFTGFLEYLKIWFCVVYKTRHYNTVTPHEILK